MSQFNNVDGNANMAFAEPCLPYIKGAEGTNVLSYQHNYHRASSWRKVHKQEESADEKWQVDLCHKQNRSEAGCYNKTI